MRLEVCRNIEYALHWLKFVILIPVLPFGLVGMLFTRIWTFCQDTLDDVVWRISNKMVRGCDEVKDGTIKNPSYKNLTAIETYTWLEADRKN